MRSREYLTPAEIEKLIKAAKEGRWGLRDACLIMVAYRHGLLAKEACELEWNQVEFGRSAALHVRRAKKGKPAVHPIRGDELRLLSALRKDYPDTGYVFTTERGTPIHAGRHQPACEDHRRTGRAIDAGALSHVEAFVRLQAGKRWDRHPGNPGLAGPRLDHAHHALHGAEHDAFQRFLEVIGRGEVNMCEEDEG
jgi:integrase